jgi:hypothetical protein
MNLSLKFNAYRAFLLVTTVLLVLVLGSNLADVALADPGELFVTPGGSGLDCTQTNPCDLQTAILQALDGDVIYLAAGTYQGMETTVVTLNEDVSLFGGWDGTATSPVVRNTHLYPTILDGEQKHRVVDITLGASPVLDGLVITNGYGDFSGGGVYSENSHPTIQDCQIQDNHAEGDGGGIFINRGSAQIKDNQIINNSGTWAGGLRIINNAQVTLRGNFISGNTADISVGGVDIACCGEALVNIEENWIINNTAGTYGGGIAVTETNAVLINNIIAENTANEGAGIYLSGTETYPVEADLINNTLIGLSSSDQGIWVGGSTNATLTNNILKGFTTGILDDDPLSNTISADHNLFYNTNDPVLGIGAIRADPLLNANYHLVGNSPAIDAGIAVANPNDIDGDPRPNGGYDLGADEYYPFLFLPMVVNSGGGT